MKKVIVMTLLAGLLLTGCSGASDKSTEKVPAPVETETDTAEAESETETEKSDELISSKTKDLGYENYVKDANKHN